jgi:hypothetical protein
MAEIHWTAGRLSAYHKRCSMKLQHAATSKHEPIRDANATTELDHDRVISGVRREDENCTLLGLLRGEWK